MSAQNQIPSDIAAIIEQKRLALRAKFEAEKQQETAQRNSEIATGTEVVEKAIAEALKAVPEWLHPYDVTKTNFDANDLARIGSGSTLNSLHLEFHIPGLAPIQFRSQKVKGTENVSSQWRSAQSYLQYHEYGPNEPALGFTNSSYWLTDLEYILVEALDKLQDFEANQAEYNRDLEANRARAAQDLKREEEADARRAAAQQQAAAEELQLFNTFKNDPIAIAFLRAFQMINEERSTFTDQIESANYHMYSMEERWSRRAEDLHRQADEAQRRAEDEKYRLQSDLDDAEAKLKKAQRRW